MVSINILEDAASGLIVARVTALFDVRTQTIQVIVLVGTNWSRFNVSWDSHNLF
jgi:hypothetical protein